MSTMLLRATAISAVCCLMIQKSALRKVQVSYKKAGADYERFNPGTTTSRYGGAKGMGFYAAQGPKEEMQDRLEYVSNGVDTAIGCVFDGHEGKLVSKLLEKDFAGRTIYEKIKEKEAQGVAIDWRQMLTHEVTQADVAIQNMGQRYSRYPHPNKHHPAYETGSTLLCEIVYRNAQLISVAVGDTRAVLCDANGRAWDATIDHKPDRYHTTEYMRLQSVGANVQRDSAGEWRVNGEFPMSRAMGYFKYKWDPYRDWIISTPDVKILNIAPQPKRPKPDKFIILATNGLWNVIQPQEAVNVVLHELRKFASSGWFKVGVGRNNAWLRAARALVDAALRDRESDDNVSVMIMDLDDIKRSA